MRDLSEEALADEPSFEDVADALALGVPFRIHLSPDGRKSRWVRVGANCESILGITREELMGNERALAERILSEDREKLLADRAAYVASEALALWRGGALPDLEDWEPGRVEAVRLEGLRMDAEELWVEAEIAAGRARQVIEDARAQVTAAPGVQLPD